MSEQAFVITLSNNNSTTTIPVKVTVYDADVQVIPVSTIPPTVFISTKGAITNEATQTISGTVAAGGAAAGATVYLYDNGSTTPIATATVGSGGNWTTSVTLLGDGAHSIVAKDTDVAGSTGISSSLSFTIDTTAPAVAIGTLGGPVNQAAQTISGTGEAGTTVTLFDNGSTTALGTAIVQNNGNWSTSVTLSGDGNHSIVAKDTDVAGNTGPSAPVVFTLNTTSPTVSWLNGVNGDWTGTPLDWSSGQAPNATSDVTIDAPGIYTVTISTAVSAHSLLLNAAGATVSDIGSLALGGLLTIQAGSFQLSGSIIGGTINDIGSGLVAAGGTLDGVTYQGLLDLSANSSLLYVKDGFTGGAGGATINLAGGGSELRAEGSETIDNAIINIGNNDGNWSGLENYDLSGAGTLALGPNLTINQVGLYALLTTSDYGLSGSGIVNKGTINANLSGGDFIIQAYRYAFGDGGGSFTNLGTINVANGDTLTIDSNLSTGQLGTVTTTNGGILQIGGILNNTGATLVVSPGSALTLIASGSITNGTIQDTGSGLISFGGTLDGVTYQGLLDLSANSSLLYVKDGFTGGAGGATISLTGGGSELRAEGSETIDNAIINIGNNDGNWSGLENYDLSGAGTLTLRAESDDQSGRALCPPHHIRLWAQRQRHCQQGHHQCQPERRRFYHPGIPLRLRRWWRQLYQPRHHQRCQRR